MRGVADDCIAGSTEQCDGSADSMWPACDLYVGCCAQHWQCQGPPAPPVDYGCGWDLPPDGACLCSVSGPGQPIVTHCQPNQDGEFLCTCVIGTTTVGTCSAGFAPDACDEAAASDPFFGCCSQFW